LSFDDNSMDGYTIAFGIRNVTHIEKALAEAYRYLLQITYTLFYSGIFSCVSVLCIVF